MGTFKYYTTLAVVKEWRVYHLWVDRFGVFNPVGVGFDRDGYYIRVEKFEATEERVACMATWIAER